MHLDWSLDSGAYLPTYSYIKKRISSGDVSGEHAWSEVAMVKTLSMFIASIDHIYLSLTNASILLSMEALGDSQWILGTFELLNTTIQEYLDEWNKSQGLSLAFILYNIVLASLSSIVGSGLLYCVHIYEKYGVDSQRRTTTNMIISQICAAADLNNFRALPTMIIFCVYGSLGKYFKRSK